MLTATAQSVVAVPRRPVPARRGRGGQLAGGDQSLEPNGSPPRQRAWVVALFDSGTALGGVMAPLWPLRSTTPSATGRPPVWLPVRWGFFGWWPGSLFIAVPAPHWPQPACTRRTAPVPVSGPLAVAWRQLLAYRQTWGSDAGTLFARPVLVFRRRVVPAVFEVARILARAEVPWDWSAPLAASIVGNFAGGALSSYLIRPRLAGGPGPAGRAGGVRPQHDGAWP